MAYVETSSGALLSSSQLITATVNSTNVFDITGAGSGNAPAMIGTDGKNTAMGSDIGAGDGIAIPYVMVTNASTTAGTGSGTFTITLQAAPDNGSYSPGTYYTLWVTEPFAGTAVTAPFQLLMQVPPIPPGATLPRFYRLVYTTLGNIASFTATLTANLLFNPPTVRDATLYGSNFVSV